VLLRRVGSGTIVVVALGLIPVGERPANAKTTAGGVLTAVGDVLGFPFRWLGGQIVGGGVDKLKGALPDLDVKVTQHEDRIAGLAGGLVADAKVKIDDSIVKVDHALEARILQVQSGADEVVERAFDRVDSTVDKVDLVGKGLIVDAGKELQTALHQVDEILRARTADIDRLANGLVDRADQAAKDRLDQIDEIAGRRLGDVDVIASKQRLAFEQTGIRLAIIVGAVVFVVFVLQGLWTRYAALLKDPDQRQVRGGARTLLMARRLGPALVQPLVFAACGAAVLAAFYLWLPLGAAREMADLADQQESELAASVDRMDYVGALFHASQISFLSPTGASAAQGLAEETGLLRDLIARPGLLATRNAIAAFEQRVGAAELLLGACSDANLLTMQAIVAWESGPTRREERQAASFAARALEVSSRRFVLSPVARAIVETYLAAPYLGDPQIGRDALSIVEMRTALAGGAPDDPGSPFAPVAALSRLMREVDRTSTRHYVAMVEAQARIAALPYQSNEDAAPEVNVVQRRVDLEKMRHDEAQAVLEAWSAFDSALRSAPGLDGPIALKVFRLNDAVLTRARWFLVNPDVAAQGRRLDQVGGKDGQLLTPIAERLQVAPARIAWARRYSALFTGPARQVVEFEETERFREWEKWCINFEQAMAAQAIAAQTGADDQAAHWRTEVAASALGLYVDDGSRRIPLARRLADGAPLRGQAKGSIRRRPPTAPAPVPVTPDAPANLEEALLVRGPRLL
jgi:hypothetical protein